jgi:hypothetical protein
MLTPLENLNFSSRTSYDQLTNGQPQTIHTTATNTTDICIKAHSDMVSLNYYFIGQLITAYLKRLF